MPADGVLAGGEGLPGGYLPGQSGSILLSGYAGIQCGDSGPDAAWNGWNTEFAAHETEGNCDTGYYGDGSRHHRRQNRRSGCGGR